ncbi:hypothetical protein VHEMI06578 [[Torrubiella] hemipterigena]|uniref:Autophagy-related protein 29 n=1 Tax=[Torrubiella] hemipterigena TaxID=1531966 RepID=A0A0A1T7Q4_9HYPO|nr:hypothetical protein VHEMI06578 [[Torrubiella] hemipterigena]
MSDPKYTVYVRVPIPRGDFVDPPPVNWDSSKDDDLWRLLSSAGQQEIDWNQIADRFDVTVEFLLQQVAYLTERHASQVRAQVRKATAAAKGSNAPSPVPTAEAINRPPASVAMSRDPSALRNEENASAATLGSVIKPTASRNASGSTITKETGPASPRIGSGPLPTRIPSDTAPRQRLGSLPISSPLALPDNTARSPSPAASEQSSDESAEEEDDSVPQSRIIRRPPRFQPAETDSASKEVEDEAEPAFQPFRSTSDHNAAQDLASTLREEGRAGARRGSRAPGQAADKQPQRVDSFGQSNSSSKGPVRNLDASGGPAISPRRKADMASNSPSNRSKGQSQDGSEGTPSMGSSFSDLDGNIAPF